MKICSSCRSYKEVDDFGFDKNTSSGRYALCRKCASLVSKAYYQKNKERLLMKAKEKYVRKKKPKDVK